MCTSPPPQPPNCRPNENYYAPETAHLALITHLVQESSKTQAQRQIKSRLQHITGVGLRTIWSLSLKKSRGKGERREDVKMTWKSSLMSELQWQNSNDCFPGSDRGRRVGSFPLTELWISNQETLASPFSGHWRQTIATMQLPIFLFSSCCWNLTDK